MENKVIDGVEYLHPDIAEAQTKERVREVLLEVRSRIRPKMEDHPLLREDILVHTIDNILKDYQ